MCRINYVLQRTVFAGDIGVDIFEKALSFKTHEIHRFAKHSRDLECSCILAVSQRKVDFLELMSQFPLIIRVVGLMLGEAFIVQSHCSVSHMIDAVVVLGVEIFSSQIELFHHGATDTFFHPFVRTKYGLIVDTIRFNVRDVRASIVTDIVMDVIVVVNCDGHCVETVGQSNKPQILVNPVKVSDTKGWS